MSGPHHSAPVSRREFVRAVGVAGFTAAAVPLVGVSSIAASPMTRIAGDVGPKPTDAAETAVARLFQTMSKEQLETICFPFDHPLRSRVRNNWAIVPPTIDEMSTEQQELCKEIMKGICSEDGFERFMYQMDEDYGGFGAYHVAIFGEPGTDKPFEWVLSGRHDTLRADGNSVEGAAFGGPIFYGHSSKTFNEGPQHTGNVWWYQAEQANRIFDTLDETQRNAALVGGKRAADSFRTVQLKGAKAPTQGVLVGDLDDQQKKMVGKLIEDMLLPFRATDADETRACLKEAGGLDPLRLTFYKDGDIGNDGVWDVWKLEGPAFAWYFHGEPHVHTWLNVASKAPSA